MSVSSEENNDSTDKPLQKVPMPYEGMPTENIQTHRQVSVRDDPRKQTFGPAAFLIFFAVFAGIFLLFLFGLPAIQPIYSSWRVEQYVNQAQRMISNEDYRSANIMLRNAWRHLNRLGSDHPNWKNKAKLILRLFAESSYKTGEKEYPLYYAYAFEQDPEDENLASETLQALIESKRNDLAVIIIPTIAAKFENNPQILHLIGMLLIDLGELQQGYTTLKKAAELAPNNQNISLSLGVVEALSQDPTIAERGRQALLQARNNPDLHFTATTSLAEIYSHTDPEKSLELWNEVVEKYPDDFESKVKRVRILHRLRPADVAQEVEKIWLKFPSLQQRLILILISSELQGIDFAQDLLDRLPNKDRFSPSARLLQISLYAAREQWNNVIETAQFVTEDTDAPDHQVVSAWLWIARANKNLGNEDTAATSIQNAAQKASNIPLLLLVAAQQLERWGMNSEAQVLYRQASNYSGGIQLIALNSLARYAQQQRNSTELLEIFEKLHILRPNNPLIMNNLAALLLMRNEQIPRALDLAQQVYMASAANQRVPEIADTYALALALNNRVAEALEVYSKLPLTSLENPSIRLHYARVLALAGQKDDAWEILKEVNSVQLFREEQEMLDALRKELL